MKKKVVMVLLTATMVGAMMTGCGSKSETTDTSTTETVESTEETEQDATEETASEDATEETAEVEETDATDAEAQETDDTTSDVEIDESTILDSEVPEDPEEALKITLAIKDLQTRFDYFQKVGAEYLNDETSDRVSKWEDITEPYYMSILMMEEITD